MTRITVLLGLISLLVQSAIAADPDPLHKQLDGFWESDLVAVVFSFEYEAYILKIHTNLGELGKPTDTSWHKLKLVKESPKENAVIFTSDGNEIKATFTVGNTDEVLLTMAGKIPLLLKRMKVKQVDK